MSFTLWKRCNFIKESVAVLPHSLPKQAKRIQFQNKANFAIGLLLIATIQEISSYTKKCN